MKTFDRYAKFIQEYIYKEGWDKLRDVQEQAGNIIFDEDANILLSTPTSSGKTEAALFPLLTLFSEKPNSGVRAIYISPLKALINDQFARMKDILKKANVKVYRWHGDVSSSQKNAALESINSILQITPESLESLFINHFSSLTKLFNNLDFIIIDEIHYFLDSIRGLHLVSLLNRLENLISKRPRYILLSATLKNPDNVKELLGIENIKVLTDLNQKKQIRLLVDNNSEKFGERLYHYINGYQTIVFSSSRKMSEDNAILLKNINNALSGNNYIYVHHGSISKELREEVESKLKNGERIVVCATNTLELGIDIGSLERVIQVNTPLSINSMVQRLGRTGRKGNPQEMVFCFNNKTPVFDKSNKESLYSSLNISFFYALSVIELYTKEKYLEEFSINKYPYELLFQQTLSYLTNYPGISVKHLVTFFLSINPFKNISKEDYLVMLRLMKEKNYIEQDNNNLLYLGSMGEKLIRDYHFYAMFDEQEMYDVYHNDKRLGQVNKPDNKKAIFNLAGSSWQIDSISQEHHIIKVKPSTQYGDAIFTGNQAFVFDEKVIQKMFELLANYQDLPYLSKSAKEYYQVESIIYNLLSNNNQNNLIKLFDNYLYIPKCGSKKLNYLLNKIRTYFKESEIISTDLIPLGIMIKCHNENRLKDILNNKIDEEFNLNINDGTKYQYLIPHNLLMKRLKNQYTSVYKDSEL